VYKYLSHFPSLLSFLLSYPQQTQTTAKQIKVSHFFLSFAFLLVGENKKFFHFLT